MRGSDEGHDDSAAQRLQTRFSSKESVAWNEGRVTGEGCRDELGRFSENTCTG